MKFGITSNAVSVLRNLLGFKSDIQQSIKAVLLRSSIKSNNNAVELLSGHADNTGGYPVPVVSGYLRRMQTFIGPGESKNIPNVGVVRTGNNEFALANGSLYALTVHDGLGTNSKHGKRPFMQDAIDSEKAHAEFEIKDLLAKKGKERGF